MTEIYNGPERRADHDTIVTMKRDVRHLCIMVKEMRDDIKTQRDICSCRMKDCTSFFVTQKVFYTILFILTAFVGTVGTVAYNNKAVIESHVTWSVEAAKRIDQRVDGLSIPFPKGHLHEDDSNADDSN